MKFKLQEFGENKWIRFSTWIIRWIIGGVFIFSGFAKCIDPYGTLYKIIDYVGALGLSIFPEGLLVVAAFSLAIAEFSLGVFLLFGCFRRISPILLCAVMCFMLPFSFWIMIANPVEDCGCFGDALIISNSATFWKNVGLSLGTVWLLIYNKSTGWLIRPYMQWMAVIATGLYAGIISYVGYSYQPLIDFRPFKENTRLYSEEESETHPSFIFIYSKDGKTQEFTEENLPDEEDGWLFVDRKQISEKASKDSDVKEGNLVIWDKTEDEEVTSDVISNTSRQILILFPSLSNPTAAESYTINSMHSWANSNDIDFAAIMAGSQQEINTWEDLSMPDYPIYRAEDTTIKEIARGNPAVVYLDKGVIKWKRTLKSLPVQDFMEEDTPADPMAFYAENKSVLINITLVYVSVLAVLCAFSFLPHIMASLFPRRKEKQASES